MKRVVMSKERLGLWIGYVQSSNLSYYKVRRQIFSQLGEIVHLIPNSQSHGEMELDNEDYNTVWSFLTARNGSVPEAARLAFEKVLDSWLDKISADEVQGSSSSGVHVSTSLGPSDG